MTDPTSQPPKPPRTWRPMAAWTAALLLGLGLLGGIGILLRTYLQTKSVLRSLSSHQILREEDAAPVIEQLGGREKAAAKLSLYLRLPEWLAPDRSFAGELLGSCGESGVPALTRALDDKDWIIHWRAIWHLGRIGPPASPAAPKLVELLRDKSVVGSVHIDEDAENAIALIGPKAVPALVKALRSADPPKLRTLSVMEGDWRECVVEAAGPVVESEVNALVDGYGYSPKVLARAFMGRTLRTAPDPAKILLYLCLPTDLAPRKYEAAWMVGLSYKRYRSQRYAANIQEALDLSDPDVQRAAALAVGVAGLTECGPQLSEWLLTDRDPAVRQEAAKALGTIGAGAKPFADSLAKAAGDQDLLVRLAAAAALRHVDPESAATKEALTKARAEVEKEGIPKVIHAAWERSGRTDPDSGAWLINAICRPGRVQYVQGAFVDDHYEVDSNEDFMDLRGGRKNCVTKEGAELLKTQGFVDLKPFLLVALPGHPEGAFIYIWRDRPVEVPKAPLLDKRWEEEFDASSKSACDGGEAAMAAVFRLAQRTPYATSEARVEKALSVLARIQPDLFYCLLAREPRDFVVSVLKAIEVRCDVADQLTRGPDTTIFRMDLPEPSLSEEERFRRQVQSVVQDLGKWANSPSEDARRLSKDALEFARRHFAKELAEAEKARTEAGK